MGFPDGSAGKESACQCWSSALAGDSGLLSPKLRFDPWVGKILGEGISLAWEILWTEEPGGLQSIVS